ncbi:MAG: hypothetical protein JWR84_3820 [Caulobacter sp.]|nr:hypothetical protein [Caulobacter sp.]
MLKRLVIVAAVAAAAASSMGALPALAAPKDPGKPDMYGNDPHWVKDVLYKCVVYTSRPEPNMFVRWYGKCVDGVADGRGQMVWYRNNQYAAKYDGPVVRGMRQGRGDYWTPAGDRFSVTWVFGVADGQGEWRYKDGASLSGTFREGEARGHVTYVTADKTWYGGDVNGGGEVKLPDGRMTTGKLSYTAWRQPVLTIDK